MNTARLTVGRTANLNLYFSDYFNVSPQAIEKHGAFNISLLADLPLFIDPFLLFNSKKLAYRAGPSWLSQRRRPTIGCYGFTRSWMAMAEWRG